MRKSILKLGFILLITAILTGCPGAPDGTQQNENSLTARIAAAQSQIDFAGAQIAEDAAVSKAITIKNLKLGGKTITLKASGIVLQNVSDAVVIVDQQVGNGDVTLTDCTGVSKLIVNGGGSNSIHVKNSKVANVELKKAQVRLALEDDSEVQAIVVNAAGTKIESEDNIVIPSITVNETVDTVTVKGGTVESIEVQKADSQIVVDGNSTIQDIQGTTAVVLTDEAIENGASVHIDSEKPVASLYKSTLTFITNGVTNNPELENDDFYYEYIFDIDSDQIEIQQLEYKLKLYKLPDAIKGYLYSPILTDKTGNHAGLFFDESDSNSIKLINMYDMALILTSAGIVKEGYSSTQLDARAELTTPVYFESFNIQNCGMPARLELPEDPRKPVVKVTPTAQGNKITVSNPDFYYTSIEIFAAEKEQNEWKPGKKCLFLFEDRNNSNPPSSTSIEFLDSYVNSGKEYAYYVNTDHYKATDRYESSDKNEYVSVKATGGLGEIVIQAKNSNNGIEITVPYISDSDDDDYVYFYSIDRNYDSKKDDYVKITNFNKNQIKPVIDYFVKPGNEYTYELYTDFWYETSKIHYYAPSNTVTIAAGTGLGEAEIESVEAAFDANTKIFTFTQLPQLACTLQDGFTYYVSFYYEYIYQGYNWASSGTIYIEDSNTTYDLSQNEAHTYNLVHAYSVTLQYPNGISYLYRHSTGDTTIPGMPGTIIIE